MIVILMSLLQVAHADWKYKYNHYFVPETNTEMQFGFQRGFSLGFSPFAQGPLFSASYTYLGREQMGVGLEQVITDRFSLRAQLLHNGSGFGGQGEAFVHFEPFQQDASQTKVHHGIVASGSKVGSAWFVGIGYHFGFSNLKFSK